MKLVTLLLAVLSVVLVGCQSAPAPVVEAPRASAPAVTVEPVKPAPVVVSKKTFDFSECGVGTLAGMAPCWGYTVEVEGDKATVTVGGFEAQAPATGKLVGDRVVAGGKTLVTLKDGGRCLAFGTVESALGTKELCSK